MDVRVRDKSTGVIRVITRKAYMAMGPKVYEKLGDVNPEGELVVAEQAAPNQTPQVRRSVSAAVPVVLSKIEDDSKQESEETAGEAQETPAQEVKTEVKKKGKPGRKKAISSNSTVDEK